MRSCFVLATVLLAQTSRLSLGRSTDRRSIDSHFTVAPHLVHMTFYTHPDPLQVSIMDGWITSVNEHGAVAGAVRTFENFSLPSLMGQLPWSPSELCFLPTTCTHVHSPGWLCLDR